MKKGGILTTLFSLLLFVAGAFLVVVNYMEVPAFLMDISSQARANLAITDVNGEMATLVPGVFLILEAFMILAFRKKRPYSLIFAFYLFFVYFTLIIFTHLNMGLSTPVAVMERVDASRLPLIGVLLFLEAILAVVLLYVTSAMNKRSLKKMASFSTTDDDVEVMNKNDGPYVSRKKMKRIEARERKKEEKEAEKEKRKEEKRQKKIDEKMQAETEKAERLAKAEMEKAERKEAKKEEKRKKKEEKKRRREGNEEPSDDEEESFSTEELNIEMNLPKRAVSMDEPLSFPEFAEIPRLNTIEHSEDLDMVSPDPRIRFKDSLGLTEKEEEKPEYVESRFTPDMNEEEKEDEDNFSVPSTPKYDPSQAGNHFKKGGILEATIESMSNYDTKSVKRPTTPILGLDEKEEKAQDFKKKEESFAPSNLSKDHPRYKLFESLRKSPNSQSVNVSHMPSMPFAGDEGGKSGVNAQYDSTFIKEDAPRKKLSERLDEMKRESISSSNPYASIPQAPAPVSEKKRQPVIEQEDEEIEDVSDTIPFTPPKAAEPVRKPSVPRAEDIESVDQKNKGKYDDGSDYVDPKQENEIYYSVGIGGLQSNDAGMTGIRKRARMGYVKPTADILIDYPAADSEIDKFTISRGQQILNTLHEFRVDVTLDNIVKGPTVTMYELKLADGVPVSKIKARYDDLQYALGVRSIRILAPVPGKQAVGVEVPNSKRATIGFKDMLYTFNANPENAKMAVPMILGRTITGEPISINVAKAPHLLIAGSTGSGKSVGINSLIATILYNKSPRDVRLIMVDPKVVELKIYNGIPHLLTPVITDAKKVQKVLAWLTEEMDRRYEMISRYNVRNIEAFNDKLKKEKLAAEKLPYIVLIMDEYADLMSTIGKDIEYYVGRLTAMARAVGIHLVLATQRPSAEVVTGTIKNNIPSRIAFAVASGVNSKIILDEMGAESLLGKGDMLYKTPSSIETLRIQGAFLSDGEVEKIVEQVKQNGEPDYLDDSIFEDHDEKEDDFADDDFAYIDSEEEEYERAKQIVYEKKSASASYLQRRMKIGYNKAARYVERMEEDGIVGPPNGSKPRELIKMV